VRRIRRRLACCKWQRRKLRSAMPRGESDNVACATAGGSMNEHHVVRGYRFRPLSAPRLPVLASDAMGCGPTRTHQPTQSKAGSGDRSSSTPCFFM
jgi:hypothetical protein